jgi:aminopeptidase N
MKVTSVQQNNVDVAFKHENNQLTITPKHIFTNLTYTYVIKYSGIPDDGLIIGENLHGERTFFADNWPNRAHNWFPCVDHPSDKATVEFLVKAPNKYKVVANGLLIDETKINETTKQTHWQNTLPLPTKVMVIGVADFAVDTLGKTDDIPVSSWMYPQTKDAGFQDFKPAKEILSFFADTITRFPFKKLANVQSTTMFGGMENASAIFYDEKAVTGNGGLEPLIAHEIAHQWFGDSASEIDWPHIWLSEGFATYFADLYILHAKGDSIFQDRMLQQRTKVFNYYKTTKAPVVDSRTTNLLKLLNPNSYEKGAWVLHMLRRELGDELFFKGIRAYYNIFRYSNASTYDFQSVMSQISGKDLDKFFKQWLYQIGHPIIKTNYIYFNNKIRMMVTQTQETGVIFNFPLDIEITHPDGTSEIKTVRVTDQVTALEIETTGDVKELKYDPNTWLLFEYITE